MFFWQKIFVIYFFVILFTSETSEARGSLAGSPWSQARQNRIANRYHLARIKNRKELKNFIEKNLLIPIDSTEVYYVDKEIGSADSQYAHLYRYARPWVKKFLNETLDECFRENHQKFLITSLVRTRTYQNNLRRWNRNAISGRVWWRQSSHLTGSTVDISTIGMSQETKIWMRKRLKKLEKEGWIEATEEHGNQNCFHIMVFPQQTR